MSACFCVGLCLYVSRFTVENEITYGEFLYLANVYYFACTCVCACECMHECVSTLFTTDYHLITINCT